MLNNKWINNGTLFMFTKRELCHSALDRGRKKLRDKRDGCSQLDTATFDDSGFM